PFGGVIASTLLRAIIEHPDCLGNPVSFTVNYAAPVKDGSFTINANPVRSNRSTQHWYVELRQHHNIVITATVVTAKKRDTWSSTELNMPEVPNAENVDSLSLRSEEHTSELQSRFDLVCRLLLEKEKRK